VDGAGALGQDQRHRRGEERQQGRREHRLGPGPGLGPMPWFGLAHSLRTVRVVDHERAQFGMWRKWREGEIHFLE
jgi:hypothetical protein